MVGQSMNQRERQPVRGKLDGTGWRPAWDLDYGVPDGTGKEGLTSLLT